MITDKMIDAAIEKCPASRESMRAALEAAERAAWRPTEDAPRDGTRVLLKTHDGEVLLGYYSQDRESYDGWETDAEWWPDKHFCKWRHMPAPPEESK